MRLLLAGGYWQRAWGQFWQRRSDRLALTVILGLLALALGADFLASDHPLLLFFQGRLYWFPNVVFYPELQIYNNLLLTESLEPDDWAVLPIIPWGYNQHDLGSILTGPGPLHWLGTDTSGRDVAARLVHGSRVSLGVGLLASLLSTLIGVVAGSAAGYYEGVWDAFLMRLAEVINALPVVLLLVTVLAIGGPQGAKAVLSIGLVIGLLGWTTAARLIRGEILRVRTMDFVQASRAQGAGDLWVIVRHVIPNAISPVLVALTFSMANAILLEGGLSFLGFGIPGDMASWGGLLRQGHGNWQAWWLTAFAGLAVSMTVMTYNLVGEGLRDALDPRQK